MRKPCGQTMVVITPYGSLLNIDAAEAFLGLTSGTILNHVGSGKTNFGELTTTNYGIFTKSLMLNAGSYSFSWAYAAQDYLPYTDGVFFSVAGTSLSEFNLLARNGGEGINTPITGYPTGTVVLQSYGSTIWNAFNFSISTTGTYQLGFGAFNALDKILEPTLFISGLAGTYTGTPVSVVNSGSSNIDSAAPFYLASQLGSTVNPVFQGGTLQVDSIEKTFAQNFTIDDSINGSTSTIDQNKNISTFSGVFSDASGQIGSLTIANSSSGGSVTLSGTNTYTGDTSITSGATLVLTGGGSITTSSGVADNGTFDIISTTSGASIKRLAGSGVVVTASGKSLSLTSAADTFSGVINGAGGLNITGGTETLSGANTYTGATNVNGGTLNLTGNLASTAVTVTSGTLTDVNSGLAVGTNLTVNDGSANINNNQTIANLNGTGGSVGIAAGKALTVSNGGTYAGVINGAGDLNITGGTETLSGANTYIGATNVNGGTLNLTGNFASTAVTVTSGTLTDVNSGLAVGTNLTVNDGSANINNNQTIANLNGTGGSVGITTGKALTVSNGGTYAGVINGGGDLNITGGTETLSGTNTYTGATAINNDAFLVLTGSGSISQSSLLTNNGNLDIRSIGAAATTSFNNITQTGTGNLIMSIAPPASQIVNVTVSAALNGALTLDATNGTYAPHRYTLLTAAGGVSNQFSVFNTNLSSFTRLGYFLSYDANNVYLNFMQNFSDTQASLQFNVAALQGVYALQTGMVNNSLNYDCNDFGVKGFCVSTGGRYSNASESTANTTSAMIIAGYRINDHLRIGVSADQNLYNSDVAQIASVRSNTPLMGAFLVWNQRADKTGFETKLAAGYNNSDLNVNRVAVSTSEAGQGSTALNTLSESITASYAFKLGEKYRLSPYAGVRHTSVSANSYTEQSTANVTAPLSYNGLNQESTTALLGLRLAGKVYKNTTVQTSAGFEEDMQNAVNRVHSETITY